MCAQEALSFDEDDVIDDLEGEAEEGSEAGAAAVAAEVAAEVDDSFHCFTGHAESVFCVAWNPVQPLCVASGGQDDAAYLWKTCNPDAIGEEELPCHKLEGHGDSVVCTAFNCAGTLLATAAMDGSVRVWSDDGALLRALEGPTDAVNWLSWHPRGDVLVAGSSDFSAWMWNAHTGVCMQVFSGHGGAVACGGFTPDGRSIVTAGDDADPSLKVWNPRTAECVATVSSYGFHEAGINCLDISRDGTVSLTGSSDGTARLCNLAAGQSTAALSEHEDSVEAVAFSESLLLVLLTASLDKKAIVWDKTTLARRQLYEHPDGVTCMESFLDASLFATGCLDGCVRLWDNRRAAAARELRGSTAAIQCLAVQPSGQMIMSGSDDATVRIFDIRV